MTLRSTCHSLRSQFVFPTVRKAILAANRALPEQFRVVHYAVQGSHVHLIVEASDRAALLAGVRGLSIRIARRLNQLLSRKGRLIADRWHGRALHSPRAVRNALVYVLANFKKHRPEVDALLDVCSSAPYFRGFAEFPNGMPIDEWHFPRALAPPDESAAMPAQSWLLSTGWKRHGLLSVFERPAH